MTMKLLLRVLACLGLAAALAGPAAAQTSATTDVSVTVPAMLYIEISSPTITLPAITVSDLRAGYSQPTTATLTYGANIPFRVYYGWDPGFNLIGTNNPANQLNQGNLLISRNGGPEEGTAWSGAWIPNVAPGDYVDQLSFRARLTTGIVPDTYQAALTFYVEGL